MHSLHNVQARGRATVALFLPAQQPNHSSGARVQPKKKPKIELK